MLLRMTQESDLDGLIRRRIKGLRVARGWTLDALAARCFLSPSTLSRIETGHRRIALDQLVPLARALGTTLDQLIESAHDEDVVITPHHDETPGRTVFTFSGERAPHGVTVARMRIEPGWEPEHRAWGVQSGREWFVVISGTASLRLGERTIVVPTGYAAEFSTMVPHLITAHDGPVEILALLDHEGERAHQHGLEDLAPAIPAPDTAGADPADPL